jgi:peptidoglycan/LPS O-acetylase OafA/YrhL
LRRAAARQKGLNLKLGERVSALYEVSDPKGRIVPMEGMRGLAVGLVFFVHFFDFFHGYITPDSVLFFPFYFLSTIGNLGVDLFFVISDYLIYGILLRRDQTYAKFWRRRIVRIYPVFIVAYVSYVVLSLALPRFDKIGEPQTNIALWLALNFFLLPGIFPIRALIMVAWSLSYEFLYYLFSPLVVGGLRMWKWAQRWRVALIAALYVAGYLIVVLHPHDRGRLLMFLAGVFLYESKRAGLLDTKPRALSQIGAIAFLVGAFYVFFDRHFNQMLWDGPRLLHTDIDPLIITIPLFSVAFFFICFQAFRPAGFLPALFSLKPLRYLGNMSYTVYLFHVLALEGVRYVAVRVTPPMGNQPGLFLAYFVLGWLAVVLLSTLVFALVEKPLSLAKKPARVQPAI